MSVYSLSLVAILVVAVSGGSEKYNTKFDNVDLQQILNNDRLLLSYFNCILGRGPCSPDGEELKKNIPDALENDCAKCSEKQKHGTETVIQFLIEHKPELYKEFEKHFDSKGIYRKRYEKKAASHGIKM